jgi:protein arginine N-methyltransferase 1
MQYSLRDYGWLIANKERMGPYFQALRQAVRPDSVVVDLGTGTGIFALLACSLGARRVYAIDPSEAIHVAREMAQANGYDSRMEFIQDFSTRVTLPERADILVSELRGVIPFFARGLLAMIDARRRFLAPGGRIIPQQDTLWAAPVEAPRQYHELTGPWEDHDYGLDFRAARRLIVNTSMRTFLERDQLLAPPRPWVTLDYGALDSPHAAGELTWGAARPGTAHGLALWFDALLAAGAGFSNAPGARESVYGQLFFPFVDPVPLTAGDVVSVSLEARLLGEDYLWRWDTRVLDQGHEERLKADFQQSTFFGTFASAAKLRQMAAGHVPTLNEEGQIDRLILGLMDGGSSLAEIAGQVISRFPARFAHRQEALARVGELSLKYSLP